MEHEDLMVVCDSCEAVHHKECQEAVAPVGRGPWYCGSCRLRLLQQGSEDVVEDIPLLDYLFRQRVPMDPVEADRVRTLALRYHARGNELETLVNPAGLEVLQR